MQVIRSQTPAQEAGQALSQTLARQTKSPILLLLSGGSALSVLEYVDEDVIGPYITIGVLDERFSTDISVTNFAQVKQTPFFKRALLRGIQTLDAGIHTDDTAVTLARRLEQEIVDWKKNNQEGVVIVTMGIGSDGHTAGIFPGDYGIDWNGKDLAVAYQIPATINSYTVRITVTNTFLTQYVDEAIVFAIGKEKQSQVLALEQQDMAILDTPIGIFAKMKQVTLFTSLS